MSSDTQYEGLSFGGALRWFEEGRYRDEMGLTTTAFRKLCKALGVPMLEVGDKRYVCLPVFKIAMWAISRMGKPDFLVPASRTAARGPTQQPRGVTNKLDPGYVEKNLEQIICELLAARRLEGFKTEQETDDVCREAAHRLVMSAVHLQPQLHFEQWSTNCALSQKEGPDKEDVLKDAI